MAVAAGAPGSVHSDPLIGAIEENPEASKSDMADEDALVRRGSTWMAMQEKAQATRAAFKRPAYFVLVFGWSLGLCAGFVNVVAMQTFGTYVSHTTGSTTAIGLRLEGVHHSHNPVEPLTKAASTVVAFLFGAFLCGLLIDGTELQFTGHDMYGVALMGNSLLLVLSIFIAPRFEGALIVATACGLQNAMCTSHFGAVVRTTHVTGSITDIGSLLGRVARLLLRHGCRPSRFNVVEQAKVGVEMRKLLVLGPMWCCFLLGCIAGAYAECRYGVYAMLIPASVTFLFGSGYTFFRERIEESFAEAIGHFGVVDKLAPPIDSSSEEEEDEGTSVA